MAEKMIEVVIDGKKEKYPEGTYLRDIAAEHQEPTGHTIVLATVDGKLSELYKKLTKDCEMSFITTAEQIGHKTYERSMCMLMAKAIFDVGDRSTLALRSSDAINVTDTSVQPLFTLSLVKLD